MMRYIVIGNIGAHDGWIAEVDTNDDSWTYQQLTGAHGTILAEKDDRVEADRVLADWLKCPAADNGYYCFTHNPTSGF